MKERWIEPCPIPAIDPHFPTTCPAPLFLLPQVAEAIPPRSMDAVGANPEYDKVMTRVYLSVANAEERSAFRLLLSDMKMELVGDAADWDSTLIQAPGLFVDMLVVDWEVLPDPQNTAMEALRQACPAALVIVLVSHLDPRHQAALSAGADAFISKTETPERVLERLRLAARNLQTPAQNDQGP